MTKDGRLGKGVGRKAKKKREEMRPGYTNPTVLEVSSELVAETGCCVSGAKPKLLLQLLRFGLTKSSTQLDVLELELFIPVG